MAKQAISAARAIPAGERRVCPRCGPDTVEEQGKCLKCGGRLRTAGQIRRHGWFLVGLGALYLVITAAAAVFFRSEPVREILGENPDSAINAGGILVVLLLTGLSAVAGGLRQVRRERYVRWLPKLLLLLIMAFLVLLFSFNRSLG